MRHHLRPPQEEPFKVKFLTGHVRIITDTWRDGPWLVFGGHREEYDQNGVLKKVTERTETSRLRYDEEPKHVRLSPFAILFIACAAFWFLAALVMSQALAHVALPTAAQAKGWTYPSQCCSGLDCRAVGSRGTPQAKVKVLDVPGGYQISTTKEFIGTFDKRVHDSPDGDYHWCSRGGKDDGETLCLYVPPRGF